MPTEKQCGRPVVRHPQVDRIARVEHGDQLDSLGAPAVNELLQTVQGDRLIVDGEELLRRWGLQLLKDAEGASLLLYGTGKPVPRQAPPRHESKNRSSLTRSN